MTGKDLFEIIIKKIANEENKSIIRRNFPPQIAKQKCDAIDNNEIMDLVKKINESQEEQYRHQQAIQSFIQQHYKR